MIMKEQIKLTELVTVGEFKATVTAFAYAVQQGRQPLLQMLEQPCHTEKEGGSETHTNYSLPLKINLHLRIYIMVNTISVNRTY
jgi:hypothetical protein